MLLVITPHQTQRKPPMLVLESGMLWNRPGILVRSGNSLRAELPCGQMNVHAIGKEAGYDPHVATQSPYLSPSQAR